MYKEASKQKLRFSTTKGMLSVEQLWELSLMELDSLAMALEKEYKESGKKSFLAAKSKKDKVLKMKFDLVIDILTAKVDENEEANTALGNKEYNDKIDQLIAEKKDDELKGKTVAELEKLRRK